MLTCVNEFVCIYTYTDRLMCYVHIHMYMYICSYMYIYIYIKKYTRNIPDVPCKPKAKARVLRAEQGALDFWLRPETWRPALCSSFRDSGFWGCRLG